MMCDPIPSPMPPLVDNFGAPKMFATGVSGVGIVHNTVLLTLEGVRCDHSRPEPTIERIVVGRVALTTPAAQALVLGLNDYHSQHGVSPAQVAMQGATRQ